MLPLYLDEDASDHALVHSLRSRGVDVLTSLEEQMNGKDDPAQLAYAAALNRVIFTYNVGDFVQLHGHYLSQGESHAGIIVAPQQTFAIGALMRRIMRILEFYSLDSMDNQIAFLSAWGE